MKFPAAMRSTVSPDLVVLFSDFQSGVVVKSDDRYPMGFESTEWTRADNPDWWKKEETIKEAMDKFNPIEIDLGEYDEPKIDIGNKYHKQVPGLVIDVYDVLVAFSVTNPATQHAIKKLLMPGSRGHKNVLTDLEEAHNSIKRAIQIEKGKSLEQ